MVRDEHGRFVKGGAPPPPADELPPLLNLVIEPAGDDLGEDVPPLPPPLEPAAAGDESLFADTLDEPLGHAVAGGINELVGLLFGAEFRASEEAVNDVGEAAEPVVRRVLVLVHAGEHAEAHVPPWARELGVLAARAWVAWGDVGWIVFEQAKQRVAELRAGREVDSAETGSAHPAGGVVRGAGGASGPDADGAGPIPPGAFGGQTGGAPGPDSGRPAHVDRLLAIDAATRRR